MAATTAKTPKSGAPTSIATSRSLFAQSLRDYRANWKFITGLMIIISLPVAILSVSGNGTTAQAQLAGYLAAAQLIMNSALIYGIIKRVDGKKVTIRQAYYQGSGALVRLVLVSLLLTLMILPLVIGLFILNTGIYGAGEQLAIGEILLLAATAVIISIPSLIWIPRAIWSIFIIYGSSAGPIEAIKQSRAISKGKNRVLLGRLLTLGLWLILVAAVPTVALVFLQYTTGSTLFQFFLQLILALTILPLASFYGYRCYKGLQDAA